MVALSHEAKLKLDQLLVRTIRCGAAEDQRLLMYDGVRLSDVVGNRRYTEQSAGNRVRSCNTREGGIHKICRKAGH